MFNKLCVNKWVWSIHNTRIFHTLGNDGNDDSSWPQCVIPYVTSIDAGFLLSLWTSCHTKALINIFFYYSIHHLSHLYLYIYVYAHSITLAICSLMNSTASYLLLISMTTKSIYLLEIWYRFDPDTWVLLPFLFLMLGLAPLCKSLRAHRFCPR